MGEACEEGLRQVAPVPFPLRPLIAVVPACFALVAPSTAGAGSATETSLLREMNRVRVGHHLRPLRMYPSLERAAREYSLQLLRDDVFTHGDFAARIKRHAIPGTAAGENLAWGAGSLATAHAVVAGWMASPGHRANLLRPGFRYVGVGTATGRFEGVSGATVVTADFAGS
jgi:uncharacterized protein YkwD